MGVDRYRNFVNSQPFDSRFESRRGNLQARRSAARARHPAGASQSAGMLPEPLDPGPRARMMARSMKYFLIPDTLPGQIIGLQSFHGTPVDASNASAEARSVFRRKVSNQRRDIFALVRNDGTDRFENARTELLPPSRDW